MHKIIKIAFYTSISICLLAFFNNFCIFSIKSDLPEIKYVDESELQMPLKIYTKDGVLIGELVK